MNAGFDRLTNEKKEQIINSAIEEFVQNGFDKASTNTIVKNAQISKGSLFNYFTNKKGLYVFLVEYGVQVIHDFYAQVDLSETDLFKRLENIAIQKFYIHKKYPYVFDFLASCVKEESPAAKDLMSAQIAGIYTRGNEIIYKDIDYSKFRENIDIKKTVEIINWTMYGFGERGIQEIDSFKNLDQFSSYYLKEWRQYAHLLKESFYK